MSEPQQHPRRDERPSGILRWIGGAALREREQATEERQRATQRLLARCDDPPCPATPRERPEIERPE